MDAKWNNVIDRFSVRLLLLAVGFGEQALADRIFEFLQALDTQLLRQLVVEFGQLLLLD